MKKEYNKDVIIIAGPPGAGKTTLLKALRAELSFPPTIDFGWIRQFHLDDEWSNANKKEEEMSFENLNFIVRNYLKYGYKNILLTDFTDERITKIPHLFSDLDYIIFTLFLTCDERLKERVLSPRDSGWKDYETAISLNKGVQERPTLKNEYKIDNTNSTPHITMSTVLNILETKDQ